MTISTVITQVAMLLELVVCAMGLYAGYAKKKTFGYLFAVAFLLFALFDYIGTYTSVTAGPRSVVNVIAVLAALAGMYLIVKD